MGGAIGVAGIGTVFFGRLGDHSFRAAFIHTAPVVAIAFLACAALSLVLPKTADQVRALHVPGLRVAAGGQVIEDADGFSVGPATAVGVIAALIILLLTFGSPAAAGMPLITAGAGLITGVALIGLATDITSMSNISRNWR
jgi:hypothetical protein